MSDPNWPPDEIKRLAQSSGKPLEVSTATALIGSGWATALGSYFVDGGQHRELDVFTIKEVAVGVDSQDVRLRVRALISCKGFRPNCAPMTYSVSNADPSTIRPRLLFASRVPLQKHHNAISAVEGGSAALLLKFAGLTTARPLVAFDVVEREERPTKQGAAPRAPLFKSIGDRLLYEGLDSALRASFYWHRVDQNRQKYLVTLYVPILLLSRPFLDVCIDGGVASDPEQLQRGYQTCLYPLDSEPSAVEVMSLVWSGDDLPGLVITLDALFGAFTWKLKQALGLVP